MEIYIFKILYPLPYNQALVIPPQTFLFGGVFFGGGPIFESPCSFVFPSVCKFRVRSISFLSYVETLEVLHTKIAYDLRMCHDLPQGKLGRVKVTIWKRRLLFHTEIAYDLSVP